MLKKRLSLRFVISVESTSTSADIFYLLRDYVYAEHFRSCQALRDPLIISPKRNRT